MHARQQCGGDDSSCAGCDGVANSGSEADGCGVCGGDGSTCVGLGTRQAEAALLTLDMPFDAIERPQFERALAAELAGALRLAGCAACADIAILGVYPGSVVVHFAIVPRASAPVGSPEPAELMVYLEALASNSTGLYMYLRTGVMTRIPAGFLQLSPPNASGCADASVQFSCEGMASDCRRAMTVSGVTAPISVFCPRSCGLCEPAAEEAELVDDETRQRRMFGVEISSFVALAAACLGIALCAVLASACRVPLANKCIKYAPGEVAGD